MTSSDFCAASPCRLEYQQMLSNRDLHVVWNPSEAILVVVCFLGDKERGTFKRPKLSKSALPWR